MNTCGECQKYKPYLDTDMGHCKGVQDIEGENSSMVSKTRVACEAYQPKEQEQ